MSATYFISDLHLDPARPDISRAFYSLLETIDGCDALYILGDLFEAWVGDDDDSELAVTTKQAMAAFSATQPLYLMRGNRDFLIGDTFCRETGVSVIDDPTRIDLYGKPVLLTHGDTLCTDDADYQALRAQVRDANWREEVLALSLAERRVLARTMREGSREALSQKTGDSVDANPKAIEDCMAAWRASDLIHGHTHRPGRYEALTGRRWVLGDWGSRPVGLKVNCEDWYLFDISLVSDT